ncbi:DUF6286 domain-containing protein [Nocardia sp. NBC_01503]|uniref:DUF6286 domain-containing protein n=1 Tax=Nocardia sp. NBC_01503 TaxID=2975997 RepID=UPI002E7C20D7|nr:DUF6286 domain-containing protein [Nocardia sp. NBC_01503]WTL30269.1 DUF6286 domain-containing protein [Nocardia sp. NBC_01503]
MIRRPRRVVPAVLLALTVLALCVVAVISLTGRLVGRSELVSYDALAGRLHGAHWSDGIVLGAGMAIAAAGLVLLLIAVLPGRPVVVALDELGDSPAGIARRSLRADLRRAAVSVHGVESPRVRLGDKKIRVSARTGRAETAGLDTAMREAVTGALDRIAPARRATVRTRLRSHRRGES